ncbi:MAG TPA: (Fe-S)-binding protein [Gemmatimonadaceae bacterium]|nr:(Fe-S)-binding protein [Gemmatimonadaceae bacterium]
MNPVLTSVVILGGVGLTFAVLIAVANRRLRVWEDPRVDAVAGMLPQANCGGCGFPGCRAFAEHVVAGKAQPAGCTVMDADGVAAVAAYLGVDAGSARKRVARLLCAGGSDVAAQQAQYRGLSSCAAAASVAGGGKGCPWGCLGLADCAAACAFGAIRMSGTGLPVVDPDKCTACGDCVEACPKELFTVMPLGHRLLVQCRNLVAGDQVLDVCRVGCTACGRCVVDAAPGLISVASGVAVVDYDRIDAADPAAVARCPTTSIVWLEGVQFARPSSGTRAATARLIGSTIA